MVSEQRLENTIEMEIGNVSSNDILSTFINHHDLPCLQLFLSYSLNHLIISLNHLISDEEVQKVQRQDGNIL